MKSFFKIVLANLTAIFIAIAGFFVFFIAFLILSSVSGGTDVKSDSILTLDLKTRIIDSPSEDQEDLLAFKSESKAVLLYDILQAIENAKTDNKIKGISLEMDNINAGITQLDDIRSALNDFKKSGKFVYAYGNAVSQGAYYLGSVADKYYLNPAGLIELKGLSTEVTFFKNFAEKYGIGIQVIRHGKFKAAVEPFLRDEISPENKEQLSTLLNDIWSNTSRKIAESRKIPLTELNTITDSLYSYLPNLSLQYKLADQLIQKSEYDNIIKKKLNIDKDKKLNKISFAKYSESLDSDNDGKKIAILYASGAIYNGKGYDGIYSENFLKEIKKLQKDDDVKAVVFRINSPGGSANASDEILFEMQQLKRKKPVVVSFGDYAASGGYYIAMGADKIFSGPNTLTGSIGVFGVVPYFKDLAEKNGIRSDVVSTNANSNMISAINGLTPGTLSIMTRSVEATYQRFVHFVTQNRKKTFEEIDAIGGGRVWSGVRAKEIGLVDELGSLQDAIKFAAKSANLKTYNVSSYPAKVSKFEQIFSSETEEDFSTRLIKSKLGKENFKIFQHITDPDTKSAVVMESPFSIKIN
ncbi:signal peptide peptidase SppA [Epilithonimonas arachidiradicis]|uniref:Protease-4 n=1 Tax=Epilithonimonas arachidiradicis TaxID=1617282 RepID=A0A420DB64_9FLAO|nr:signal peptide peptidase SppA [Epilithonimonas arachidiradicis]RKE88729.1 protease-4 [Epilithonimonas arachidiradicis]GGG55499.1 signal peptide peptidase SppA [Epilithonimonas arachidiradicis]